MVDGEHKTRYVIPAEVWHKLIGRDHVPEYIVAFDVETTSRAAPEFGFAASPFHPHNKMLMRGYCEPDKDPEILTRPIVSAGFRDSPSKVIAMHNGMFDMHYVRRECSAEAFFQQDFISGPYIWDTQVAAYILSSQQLIMPDLEECARIWLIDHPELQSKSTEQSEMVKQGRIEEIPEDDLKEYLAQDLRITLLLAHRQMLHAKETGQTALIYAMGESMKALQEMEYHGIAIDRGELNKYESAVSTESNILSLALKSSLAAYCRVANPLATSILTPETLTPKALSALLFGGTVSFKSREPAGVYKTGAKKGQPKFKVINEEVEYAPMHDPEKLGASPLKTGWYSVDEKVLSNVLKSAHTSPQHLQLRRALEYALKLRVNDKYMSTYIKGIQRAMALTETSFIHPSLNNTATATGRLSSSNPNFQNIPIAPDDSGSVYAWAPVKQLVVSRYGRRVGRIVEVDFKQLEVIALAAVTKDHQLIEDLREGRDIHTETARSIMRHGEISKEFRRKVKTVNFGLIYGGGADSLSEQAGLDLMTTKRLIKAFYHRYPKTREFFQMVTREIPWESVNNAYMYYSATSRSYAIPMSNGPYGLSPHYTRLKNYPVQGLATGDLVPMMLGVVLHAIKAHPFYTGKVHMNLTVHDSILFDVHDTVLRSFLPWICELLEDSPGYMEEVLNCKLFNGLPLKVEASYGPSWHEQEVYER